MAKDEFIQVARTVPFDNSSNGFLSDNVQQAIEEINGKASTGFVFCFYNGNANVNRYLEFFSGIDSSVAPVRVQNPLAITSIVAATTAISATCTIGFYDIQTGTPVLLYTLTFNNQKIVELSSLTQLFTVPDSGHLAVKIDSGSINRPHLYFTSKVV